MEVRGSAWGVLWKWIGPSDKSFESWGLGGGGNKRGGPGKKCGGGLKELGEGGEGARWESWGVEGGGKAW